jgi:hypothetical protein
MEDDMAKPKKCRECPDCVKHEFKNIEKGVCIRTGGGHISWCWWCKKFNDIAILLKRQNCKKG